MRCSSRGSRFVQLAGDDLISVPVAGPVEARLLATQLRDSDAWLEVVAGIDSVVVQFDLADMNAATAKVQLQRSLVNSPVEPEPIPPVIEIPVAYGGDDGPDLVAVCAALKLSEEEFVALHTAGEYTVDMLGFTPGFAYVGGLDQRLNVPRLQQPRTRVAAGSIGIADGRTGVYALPGPGGWPLIGRTDATLFDATSSDPFVLRGGMKVRFRQAGSQ